MSAPMEEAVFHESRKDSEVGTVRQEGGVLRQNETGDASLQKSNRACLGRWVCTCPASESTGRDHFRRLYLHHHAKNQDKSHQESP